MNCALSIKNWIRRWRHTRGYGVHSPLAYTIVKECIRPDQRYAFYCDSYLDFEYHEDRRGLRRARMIIRLLNLLRPAHVWFPNADKRIVTAIKTAMPRMRVATQRECPQDTDFMILYDVADTQRFWKKMVAQKECGLLAFGRSEPITDSVTLEMTSIDFQLLLRRNGMEKVRYDI